MTDKYKLPEMIRMSEYSKNNKTSSLESLVKERKLRVLWNHKYIKVDKIQTAEDGTYIILDNEDSTFLFLRDVTEYLYIAL